MHYSLVEHSMFPISLWQGDSGHTVVQPAFFNFDKLFLKWIYEGNIFRLLKKNLLLELRYCPFSILVKFSLLNKQLSANEVRQKPEFCIWMHNVLNKNCPILRVQTKNLELKWAKLSLSKGNLCMTSDYLKKVHIKILLVAKVC